MAASLPPEAGPALGDQPAGLYAEAPEPALLSVLGEPEPGDAWAGLLKGTLPPAEPALGVLTSAPALLPEDVGAVQPEGEISEP